MISCQCERDFFTPLVRSFVQLAKCTVGYTSLASETPGAVGTIKSLSVSAVLVEEMGYTSSPVIKPGSNHLFTQDDVVTLG